MFGSEWDLGDVLIGFIVVVIIVLIVPIICCCLCGIGISQALNSNNRQVLINHNAIGDSQSHNIPAYYSQPNYQSWQMRPNYVEPSAPPDPFH